MRCHILGVIATIVMSFGVLCNSFTGPSCPENNVEIEGNSSISCSTHEDTVYLFLDHKFTTQNAILTNFFVSCYSNNESYNVSLFDYNHRLIKNSFSASPHWSGSIKVSGFKTRCELFGCFDLDGTDYHFPNAAAFCTSPTMTASSTHYYSTMSDASTIITPSTSFIQSATSDHPLATQTITIPASSTGYNSELSSSGTGHYYTAVLTVPVVMLIVVHLCLMFYIRRRKRREKKMRDIHLGVWIQNDVLEHNYTPISIKEIVIPRSSSLESFEFCQPNCSGDLTERNKNKAVEESRYQPEDTFGFSDGDYSLKDSHDGLVADTEKSDKVGACEVVETQSVAISNNGYFDVNKLSPNGNSLSEVKNEKCTITNGYVTTETLSLDLMDVVPLDTSDLPNQLPDSVGYIITSLAT